MTSDVPLDYALFQLSPRRSRCELFVSYDGTMEKLASGLVEPFVNHLKVAEEQVDLAVKSIKLEVDKLKNAEKWFTKGTLERFVQFVGTPEVLEMVNTLDAEMSQLEAARSIYSQGVGDHSGASGGDGGTSAASDATKKELLRAIDVRLVAVKQDLTTACTRALAAGFNSETISELQLFADRFGAHRLSEACGKFITITQRRADLFKNIQPSPTWKSSSDLALRSSSSSDMSIDEPSDDQPKHSVKVTFPLRRFSREPSPSPVDDREVREKSKPKDIEKDKSTGPTSTTESDPSPSTSSQTPQLTRRLSVQERISMFENKAQKENSPSTTAVASSGGKPELRRLSSDVNSSTDKAVLRRWSGASDMSIDVSGEKKEFDSSATPTPTSTSTPHPVFPPKPKDHSDLKVEEAVKESKLPVKSKFGSHFTASEESATSQTNSKITSVSEKSAEISKSKDFESENQPSSVQIQLRSQPGKSEKFVSSDQTTSEEKINKSTTGEGSKIQDDIRKKLGDEDDRVRDRPVSTPTFKASHRKTVDVSSESAVSEAQTQAPMLAQPRWRSAGVETEKNVRKDPESFEKQADISLLQMETSSSYRGKFQGHGSGFDQVKKPGVRREDSVTATQLGLNGKSAVENQEVLSSSSVDQVQRVKQSKGNLGLNDDLKMKANELEKLFAEHKLRTPSDQSNSSRRTRAVDAPLEQEMPSPVQMTTVKLEGDPAGSSRKKEKNNSTPIMRTVDNQEYDVTPKQNTYSLSFSDDSRGKLYQKYMQKRDAKLREDWSSKRVEKEAKIKAMQDSLERSKAEMVKLAGSADKRTSSYDSRQRAEKMRSFYVRSAMKREQSVESFMSDEDEDKAEVLGKKLSETYLGDSSSRSAQSKKVVPNRSTTSSAPRNSALPVPRSSGKASNSAGGRRRLPSDNPLAQSVPNFSDLRKENTKPFSAGSKAVRPQRNHVRKKSVTEDLPLVNEEKPWRSNSMKKSLVNPAELNDSHDFDDLDDANFSPSVSKGVESKPLSRKGNGASRSKSSVMEALVNGHDLDNSSIHTEEMTDVPKDVDDYETAVGGEYTDMNDNKGRLSHETDKSANSEYGESNALSGISQVGPACAVDLPTSMSSLFRMGSLQDSPSGSPGSWNSRVHNPFSFPHEISDIDASDSPLGSPASWNFHTLNQNDAEAARMRKKWGAAQKPIVGDSSHSLSRKDVTKGFKRFLKFGRKNRATESMADWFSVTTSEGDDDTEDGRDLANRSSEDLRKSRMGFSHSQHSDEGYNEDLFNDQVQALQSSIPTPTANFKYREEQFSGSSLKAPKSFFSLSNFRSKGSDSKAR